jgi:NDP-sugar pyrophosphorylase family protein
MTGYAFAETMAMRGRTRTRLVLFARDESRRRLHAIILAGGLGTRLRPVVADRPKAMAPIGGRPFLHYLLVAFARQGFDDIVLCVGHRAEQIEAYFGSGADLGVRLRYSLEAEPLGTAGALRLAEPLLDADEYLVANGDSYLGAACAPLFDKLHGSDASAVIALHRESETGRYGSVDLDSRGRIKTFVEKDSDHGAQSSLINAGLYALRRSLIEMIPPGPASLERDALPRLADAGRLYGVELAGPFIDIGVPDDYRRLERDWRALFGSEVAE